MGIKLSKQEEPNPLVVENFDGESGDYPITAGDVHHGYHPDWVVGDTEVEQLRDQLKELDNMPENQPLFSFNGTFMAGKCTKVYDGDTCWFNVKVHDRWVKMRFRMMGYNSPELRTKDADEKERAKQARDYLANMLLDRKVILHLHDFDKYGRPLTDVYLVEDEGNFNGNTVFKRHVNQEMIDSGHGVIYHG